MLCGMCVAAMVRPGIESPDLAPLVAWVPGLLRVRRHDRDGSRAFVASDFLVPFGRVGHRDAIEQTRGRPKADEAFAAGEPRIRERESGNDLLSQPGTAAPHFRKEA